MEQARLKAIGNRMNAGHGLFSAELQTFNFLATAAAAILRVRSPMEVDYLISLVFIIDLP